MVTPTFYIPSRAPADEQLRLFAACREAAGDMEMIGYNIPQAVGVQVAVETFCEAARRGWMRHCKESSGDLQYLSRLVVEGRAVGLRVLMGDEVTAADGLRAGAVGLVNLCVNVEPATYLALYDAAVRGDEPGAGAAARAHQPDRARGGVERPVFRGGAEIRAVAVGDRPRRAGVAAATGGRGAETADRSFSR